MFYRVSLALVSHWSMFTSACRWQRRLADRNFAGFLEQNYSAHDKLTKKSFLLTLILYTKPEDQWSCNDHLSAEDTLKSVVIEEKKFKKYWIWVIWNKVNERPWALVIKASCTHLVDCIYQLLYHILQWFLKIHCFNFFSYKSIGDQIWHCRKIGQGQPRDIIWTNLVVLEYLRLHTKFQGHGLSVPEKIFKGFYHVWTWRPSWSFDLDHLNKFSFSHPKKAPHEISLQSA